MRVMFWDDPNPTYYLNLAQHSKYFPTSDLESPESPAEMSDRTTRSFLNIFK